MTAEAIAQLAWDQRLDRAPDRTIRQALGPGDFTDAAWRARYLEAERAWRRLLKDADGVASVCAHCGGPLSPLQTKWCGRKCWSLARTKGRGSGDTEARNREILRMRAEGKLLREIAERFGVSTKRISQILARAA